MSYGSSKQNLIQALKFFAQFFFFHSLDFLNLSFLYFYFGFDQSISIKFLAFSFSYTSYAWFKFQSSKLDSLWIHFHITLEILPGLDFRKAGNSKTGKLKGLKLTLEPLLSFQRPNQIKNVFLRLVI